MKYDLLVVGGGPAGLTAAIHARARNRSVVVVSNEPTASPLCKSPRVDNYPGLPGISGTELVERLANQAMDMGAELRKGRVLNVMPLGDLVMASVGTELVEASAAILAVGIAKVAPLKGEDRLLGRGVSYCATCDGSFYRGRPIVVAGNASDLKEETEYLRSIGCLVTEAPLAGLEILGDSKVTGVRLKDGSEVPCDGVFLLRSSIAPTQMVPGLELDNGYIKVNSSMATNLPLIYAAGDCTGQPLQLAKAVGQGQLAAHWAIAELQK